MLSKPPSPYRANSGGTSVDLNAYLADLFEAVGFSPEQPGALGTPGSYTGTVRCGGDTYQRAVELFAREVMSKFDDANPASENKKREASLAKFREAEELCTQTNKRFNRYFYGHRPDDPVIARVLRLAREKIGWLLGELDPSEVQSGCTFTTGGSVLLPRSQGTSVHKYSTTVETTSTNLSLLSDVFRQIPAWGGVPGHPRYCYVEGNKLHCVPKNYKTHRMIAGEPSGNMYIQKGLHSALRRRLKRVGVDLDDQTMNQELAKLGSATGLVATVDMSMASDTVAYAVVEWFLSLNPDWWEWLQAVRSPMGWFGSDRVIYRKFSSMGNATTFELETLIFWALAVAVCEVSKADRRFVAVYGDDVVIPTRCTALYIDVLRECGFVPNVDKTFWEEHPHSAHHRYRESCGKHYFRGEDVTPVYIKDQPSDLLSLFKLLNNAERWRRRLEALSDTPAGVVHRLKGVIVKYRRLYAPAAWCRPRIPDGYGDGAFIGTFDECTPTRKPPRKRTGWEGWFVEVLSERYVTALGVNEAGEPLYRDGKGVLRAYVPKHRRNAVMARRVLSRVNLRGYLLSSLERLERSPAAWHKDTRRATPRMAALMAVLTRPHAGSNVNVYSFESEQRGIELSMSRQV